MAQLQKHNDDLSTQLGNVDQLLEELQNQSRDQDELERANQKLNEQVQMLTKKVAIFESSSADITMVRAEQLSESCDGARGKCLIRRHVIEIAIRNKRYLLGIN